MKPTSYRPVVSDERVAGEQEKQRRIALQRSARLKQRLAEVSYPLRRAAADFCPEEQRAGTGIYFTHPYAYQDGFRDTARVLFKLPDGVKVSHVVSGTPAAKAGILPGDRLLVIGGHTIQPGEAGIKALRRYYRKEVKAGEPLVIRIRRDGREMSMEVETERVCGYPVVLKESGRINAFSDGRRVLVTPGMIRFTENDNELGMVIAHELAHNAMHHMDARRINSMGGMVLDVLAASAGVFTKGYFSKLTGRAFSQEFEAEADYVGLYILARAGVPIEESANFWRRMAAERPSDIRGIKGATHPTTAKRFLLIEETVSEIRQKRLKGLAMEPEMKARRQKGLALMPGAQASSGKG
ncbi:MAG: M48 family metalloprotease [Sedimenticola sp.]